MLGWCWGKQKVPIYNVQMLSTTWLGVGGKEKKETVPMELGAIVIYTAQMLYNYYCP